jgi:hypothetical protein
VALNLKLLLEGSNMIRVAIKWHCSGGTLLQWLHSDIAKPSVIVVVLSSNGRG